MIEVRAALAVPENNKIVTLALLNLKKIMKKYIIYLFCIGLSLNSCTIQKKVVRATGAVEQQELMEFIENYRKQVPVFSDLQIKSKIHTDFNGKRMNANLKLYIKDNQRIWANASLFGITGARANITPNKVQFYNVLERTYVDDNFEFFNHLLKVNFINYERLQQLLLGQLFLVNDLSNYKIELAKDNQYILKYKVKDTSNPNEIPHSFYLDSNYRLKKVEITEPKKSTDITITYSEWQVFDGMNFPSLVKVLINGKQKDEIELDYTNFVFSSVNPPFKIPSGYKKQKIN